jgi:putative ABC transport system permease protein
VVEGIHTVRSRASRVRTPRTTRRQPHSGTGAVSRRCVYGLLSFVVTSRTRELGVHAAMGAQRRDLVSLIARDSAVWVACGHVAGLALAVIVRRSMSGLIYGVEPLDWMSLTTSTCLLGTVAVIAALFPVWRATQVNPMTVLRAE